MYGLLKKYTAIVLKSIDPYQDIKPYIRIMKSFRERNILEDYNFKATFRQYWRLNPARLIDSFYDSYFSLLESCKDDEDIDIEFIARKLYEIPNRKNEGRSLQFSFASKLVHTVIPTKPVYDSMVTSFYFLPLPQPHWDNERKLQNALKNYMFIESEQKRVLNEGILDDSMIKFREHFDLDDIYTDQKVVDTLIWKFIILLKSGAVRERRVIFS